MHVPLRTADSADDRACPSRVAAADRRQIEALIIEAGRRFVRRSRVRYRVGRGHHVASGRSWWRIAAGIADQSGRPSPRLQPATTPVLGRTDTQGHRCATGIELGHHRSAQPVARGAFKRIDHRHFLPHDRRLPSRRTRSRCPGGRDVRRRVHRPRVPAAVHADSGPAMRSHDLKGSRPTTVPSRRTTDHGSAMTTRSPSRCFGPCRCSRDSGAIASPAGAAIRSARRRRPGNGCGRPA